MKTYNPSKKFLCTALLVTAILSGSLLATSAAEDAKLLKKAKITREQAEKIALEKVPGGTVKEGELEKEKGKLIWSFDISTPNSKDITEVQVDAKTGKIVAVDIETPKDQAKEAAEDDKEKKSGKDDDKDEKEQK